MIAVEVGEDDRFDLVDVRVDLGETLLRAATIRSRSG